MQAKNSKGDLLAEIERLGNENKSLHKQLREAQKPINAIKTGNVDALVVANEKDFTVFTEKTTDKIYRVLIDKMNEGAVTLSNDGTILYCNACFAAMVHQPQQKVFGKKFASFIDFTSKRGFKNLLLQGILKPISEQAFIHTAEGTRFPVLMSLNSFTLDNTFVLSVILTDLSIHFKSQEELKQKAIQLEQKNIELESVNKDLTSFTYVSSHDLQEPLRKIQSFVSCLLQDEEKNLSATGKVYFKRMQLTAKRMQQLIDDLLIYSRTKSGDRDFVKTDLKTITNEVKKDFEEMIAERQTAIDVTHLGDASIIRFQFRQLLHNLISNSLKFAKPGKKLQVKIKSEVIKMIIPGHPKSAIQNDYCHITYTDNGIGFDPQYNTRIFEVFQRLHSQEEFKGTGIGLAICKRIIENHKGVITASGKLNKGARFDIYIPE